MFVFLSKLLPLFIYPLGLACLLLLVALGLLIWRQVRWAMGAIALALVVIMGSSNGWVAASLIKSLEDQAIALQEATTGLPYPELPNADAIVVLGGGIKAPLPLDPGWIWRRRAIACSMGHGYGRRAKRPCW